MVISNPTNTGIKLFLRYEKLLETDWPKTFKAKRD